MGILTRKFRRVGLGGAVTGLTLILTLAAGCSDDSGSAAPSAGNAPKPAASGNAPTKAAPPIASKPTEPVSDSRSPEERVSAGRAVYMSNCIACHNMNPVQDGTLGPAVAGSSLALLEARIMRGEYPEGHTPKRPSRVMIPLPHLEPKLPELAAYLQSVE